MESNLESILSPIVIFNHIDGFEVLLVSPSEETKHKLILIFLKVVLDLLNHFAIMKWIMRFNDTGLFEIFKINFGTEVFFHRFKLLVWIEDVEAEYLVFIERCLDGILDTN